MNHCFLSEATFQHIEIYLFKSEFLDEESKKFLSNTHRLIDHLSGWIDKPQKIDCIILSEHNKIFEKNYNLTLNQRMAYLRRLLKCKFEVPFKIRHLDNTYRGKDMIRKKILQNTKGKIPLQT